MFVANYTIVDWGPYGMWLSNCSNDINSTMCDYVTQVCPETRPLEASRVGPTWAAMGLGLWTS